MAIKFTDTQHYQDIADAIREKDGTSNTYTPAEMATAILRMPDAYQVIYQENLEQYPRASKVYNIPEGVRIIRKFAFFGINLLSNEEGHTDTSLTAVCEIPYTVNMIEERAFANNAKMEGKLTLPNVSKVETYAFQGCVLLNSVYAPFCLTLGQRAFGDCSGLEEVIFDSLQTIGAMAFINMTNCLLYDFREATAIPTLSNTSAFSGINANAKIVVPDNLYSRWITATNWSSSSIVGHIVKASDYTE